MPASTKFHLAGRKISQSQFTVKLCNLKKNLSVPSVVFAEATWYGSLRGGLQSQSGGEVEFFDGGSRWGIKGSAEVGEGLNAVYRFEHKISTTDAGQPGGRLAYAGLSGGFGSVTVGQIWNAAYNHAGAITDKSYYFGNATTGYRHGNALSYAHSTGPVSFQVDLISDGDMNTGQGIDKTEFGVTVALGEIGKVALAHTTVRDESVTTMTDRVPGTPYVPAVTVTPAVEAVPEKYYVNIDHDDNDDTDKQDVEVKKVMVYLLPAGNVAANVKDGAFTTAGLALITRSGTDGRYHFDGADAAACKLLVDADDGDEDDCVMVPAYVRTVTTTGAITRAAGNTAGSIPVTGTAATTVAETFYAKADRTDAAIEAADAVITPAVPGKDEVAPMKAMETKAGYKNTHVAVEFNIGGMTPYVGYSTKKTNMGMKLDADMQLKADNTPNVVEVPATTTKTTHFGVGGGVGDTGINFLVAARSVQPTGKPKTSPWLFNVSKNLGGGATVIFEHANYDTKGPGGKETAIGLHVTF